MGTLPGSVNQTFAAFFPAMARSAAQVPDGRFNACDSAVAAVHQQHVEDAGTLGEAGERDAQRLKDLSAARAEGLRQLAQ